MRMLKNSPAPKTGPGHGRVTSTASKSQARGPAARGRGGRLGRRAFQVATTPDPEVHAVPLADGSLRACAAAADSPVQCLRQRERTRKAMKS